jgi:multidrug transporter EmrE-like cation transporter
LKIDRRKRKEEGKILEKKTSWKVIAALHLLLVLYSFESVCSKMASQQEMFSFKFFLFYGLVLFLLFFYALAWQRILKYMPLTVAYANKGITIVWGIIWGALLFHEAITIKTIIGGVIILIGIYLVVTNNEH